LLVSPVSFGWFLFSLLSLSKGKKMAKIVSSNVGALRTARRELITLRLTIKELAARVKAEKHRCYCKGRGSPPEAAVQAGRQGWC